MRTFTILLIATLAALGSDDLFDAARRGDVADVKTALDKGVAVDTKWRYDQTALFIAARRGHSDVVRLLLERGATADVKDSFYGMTAVTAATEKGDPEIVTMLLDKGARGGDSILLMAAGRGRTELVRALAKRKDIDPTVLTQALSSAEAGKHAEAAAILREAGARPAAPLDPAALERFRGRYATVPMGREILTVEPKAGFLVVKGTSMQMDFRPLDELTFEPMPRPGTERFVFLIENGKVVGAESVQGERRIRYKRLEEDAK